MSLIHRRGLFSQSARVTLGAIPALMYQSLSRAESTGAGEGRILVVIQLSGGNDGLNTVVPFGDDHYARNRKQLRLAENRILKIDDQFGLHPSMRGMFEMLQDGRLGIIQGVGYPNPNRSHDLSMAIWHSANVTGEEPRAYGWIGRSLDRKMMGRANATSQAEMILVGNEAIPLALRGRRCSAATINDISEIRLQRRFQLSPNKSDNDLLSFVHQTAENSQLIADQVRQADRQRFASGSYPGLPLARRLESIAGLIKTGFSTSVYYAIQDGYDTHSSQLQTHSGLLRELSDSVTAFLDDLRESRLSDRVAVMVFSEFGRRVSENASAGTDHGAAGPVLLVGDAVSGGLVAGRTDLTRLDRGDVPMSVDFRSVYSGLIRDWMGVESDLNWLGVKKLGGLFG